MSQYDVVNFDDIVMTSGSAMDCLKWLAHAFPTVRAIDVLRNFNIVPTGGKFEKR